MSSLCFFFIFKLGMIITNSYIGSMPESEENICGTVKYNALLKLADLCGLRQNLMVLLHLGCWAWCSSLCHGKRACRNRGWEVPWPLLEQPLEHDSAMSRSPLRHAESLWESYRCTWRSESQHLWWPLLFGQCLVLQRAQLPCCYFKLTWGYIQLGSAKCGGSSVNKSVYTQFLVVIPEDAHREH